MKEREITIPDEIASEVLEVASRHYAEYTQAYSESQLIEAGKEVNIPAEFIQQAIQEIQAKRQQEREKKQQKQKRYQVAFKISAGILIILAIASIWSYNSLATAEIETEAAWAQVENQLQRRADLIPNLIGLTQAYGQEQKEIISLLASSREAYLTAKTPTEKVRAIAAINQAIQQFHDCGAANPQLQSSQGFVNLQYEITGTENRLAVERMRYNQSVASYNQKIQGFPNSLLAKLLGFEKKSFFPEMNSEL